MPVYYLHCNFGCGNRTPITAAGPGGLPATCPNCGHGGVTVLGPNERPSTPGYDSSGNPVALTGNPHNWKNRPIDARDKKI